MISSDSVTKLASILCEVQLLAYIEILVAYSLGRMTNNIIPLSNSKFSREIPVC
jgi:hypothetical protein